MTPGAATPTGAGQPAPDSPLAAVLLACVRDPEDARTAAALRAALARVSTVDPGQPGWEALADAAQRHGMTGLLYRRVVDLAFEAVPQAVLHEWRQSAVATQQRSLAMQRQLVALLGELEQAGVPALVFKGPALSRQLYGESGLRHSADLDVLVRPDAAAAARDVALRAGYVEQDAVDAVPFTMLQEVEQKIVFAHAETGLRLELHWRTGPRFAADALLAEELFARAVTVELLERRVQTLGLLDVLLTLTVRAAAYGWRRVEDVAATAAALRALAPGDAAALQALALEHGALRRLHVGVLLVAALADERPHRELMSEAAADRRAKDVAARAAARLVWSVSDPTALRQNDPRARAQGVLWEALGLDTRSAATRHLWRRLVTRGARDWGEPELGEEGGAPAVEGAGAGGVAAAAESDAGANHGGSSGDEGAPTKAGGAPRRAFDRLKWFARRQRRTWRPPGA